MKRTTSILILALVMSMLMPSGPALACTNFLITKGAKVNARANSGQTPLHKAANGGDRKDNRPGPGHLAAAKVLLKHGADPHAKDNSGKSPLDLAGTEEMKVLLGR